MNRTQILEAFSAHKLAHLQTALKRVLLPAIRVTATDNPQKRDLAVGGSRFGGLPGMAAKTKWPTVDGIPLMFVGQFNLEDLARFKAASVFPKSGLLSFFFDGTLTGYDRGETPDRSRVIYTDTAKTKLIRLNPPATAPVAFEVYREAAATFESTWTVPEFEEIDGEEFPSIPAIVPIIRAIKDRKNYQRMRRKVRGKYIGSKLLGHPDAVQGTEIRFGAVTRQDRGERFRYENYEWTNVDRLISEMRDLCLLFQSAMGTLGGTGVVYFWIRRQDLEKTRFERAFAELQST